MMYYYIAELTLRHTYIDYVILDTALWNVCN